jgi:hypothetical protein
MQKQELELKGEVLIRSARGAEIALTADKRQV